MKRIVTTLLIAAFIVWAIVDAVHEFRINDTAKFYSSHPGRLLYVLAIAAFGGVVVVLFYRLSPSGQRGAKLLALSGVATFLTVFVAYWLFRLLPLSSIRDASTGVSLVPLVFVGGLASGFWYEFFCVLKTGRTRFL
jgi:hypothetical protein